MQNSELTQREFWENYWEELPIPAEIRKSKQNHYQNEILRVFDSYFPKDTNLSILEIGGAPGQYLAYMHKRFGYDVSCLDYSDAGCKKTKENFDFLHISGRVYQADLFSEELTLPQFDIVYSLGLIEHFSDLDTVIEKHLRLVKPGGMLLIGTPNFLGINHFFWKRLTPKLLSAHNLAAMDIRNWTSFADNIGLEILFEGYVGGFEPGVFWRCEKKSVLNSVLLWILYALSFSFSSHFRILRRINCRHTSGYAIGVYRKPAF
jgi:2-polyprenyl-3-methyl-5-hydroxy-6-metoxy-1,4-benzoquinol methylase